MWAGWVRIHACMHLHCPGNGQRRMYAWACNHVCHRGCASQCWRPQLSTAGLLGPAIWFPNGLSSERQRDRGRGC
eukprot:1157328-Pelagomonas_calceolata.AAC.18